MNPESAIPSGGETRIIETNSTKFRADVLEPSLRKPVLVEFWSASSQAGRRVSATLARLARATQGNLALVRMNLDAEPGVAEQLGVKAAPAGIVFDRGRPADGFVGPLSDAQLKGFLERLVGPIESEEDVLKTIEALLAAGDVEAAEAALLPLAIGEGAQSRAVAELARLYVAMGRFDEAQALLAQASPAAQRDPHVLAAAAALENALQASDLGEIEELRRKAHAAPDDFQACFDLALALNAKGLHEEAASELLDIVRRDRSWNEDGARKQLVQFFEAWGPADKATTAARRKLSALLFS
jgi:putative thioredoxin